MKKLIKILKLKNREKSSEKKYALTTEALNRINKELIQNHKSSNTYCWRYIRIYHYSTEYKIQFIENRNSIVKQPIKSQNNRKRKDNYPGTNDMNYPKP
jgi:hypothetical protein